ncbi:MAG TPA: hypothetical protein PLE30_01735 [Candidatus Kapabacteria bacterium]|nr:hypothetical protein [Candidatus Kapabacteria bacterium]
MQQDKKKLNYMYKNILIFSLLTLIAPLTNIRANQKIMIGNTEFNGDVSNLNTFKLDLALNFSCLLTKDSVSLIPSLKRDSLIRYNLSNNIKSNILDIANDLGATYILFTRVNAIKHLVRTDVTLVQTKDTSKIIKSFGYASAKYMNDKNKLIYDPAIMASLQRALAGAFKDSTIFIDSSKGFFNKPAPLLAIGGIYFVDDDKLPDWYIFDKKVVNSFDALETIFESALKDNNYVTMDTETRDTIYSMNNLFIVENYAAPSEYELLALYKLGVEYYISGTLQRNADGAKLELYLYKFDKGVMQTISSAYEIIPEDSILLLRESLKYLTNKILSNNSGG